MLKKVFSYLSEIDAAGVVGPGVYYGNQNFLGNYDECVKEVKASHKSYTINVGGKSVSHQHTSDGKYCRVYWYIGDVSNLIYNSIMSVCVCVCPSILYSR